MSIRVIKTPLKGITGRLINGYISPSNNSLWLVCEYLSGNRDGNGKRLEGIPTSFYAKTAHQQQADREGVIINDDACRHDVYCLLIVTCSCNIFRMVFNP